MRRLAISSIAVSLLCLSAAFAEAACAAEPGRGGANNIELAQATATSGAAASADITQLLANSGFEAGDTGWSGTADDIGVHSPAAAHEGDRLAWMGGFGESHSETLYQNVSIPSDARTVKFSFWVDIDSDETTRHKAYDRLYVQVRTTSGHVLRTLAIYSNLNRTRGYVRKTFNVSRFAGQDVSMFLKVVEDNGKPTSFFLDDFALTAR